MNTVDLIDQHYKKHCNIKLANKEDELPTRVFEKMLLHKPAQFNAIYIKYYSFLLNKFINATAKKAGFLDVKEHVGWDRGNPTTIVQIYASGVGFHMRPKYFSPNERKKASQIIDCRERGLK